MPYREGNPIPPGYHRETRIRQGLVIAGAVTFGSLYLLTVMTAAAVGTDSDNGLTPLYVPAVGPFITMGTTHTESSLALAGLTIDGLGQCAGLAMFIAGLAAPKDYLIRNDVGGVELELKPAVGKDTRGLVLTGTF